MSTTIHLAVLSHLLRYVLALVNSFAGRRIWFALRAGEDGWLGTKHAASSDYK